MPDRGATAEDVLVVVPVQTEDQYVVLPPTPMGAGTGLRHFFDWLAGIFESQPAGWAGERRRRRVWNRRG